MIGWLNPAALWAMPLALVPVIIHLLRTHRAPRLAFPSLRFVQPSRAAAVRMRLPSDIFLMMVRAAIVALAVAAVAGPILLTSTRTTAWNARVARAVVVDASDSMGAGDAAAQAGAALEAELKSAAFGRRFDAVHLTGGLDRALAWLREAPPARREIVVISDLQRGTLKRADLSALPEGTGVRFAVVGTRMDRARFEGQPLLGAGPTAPRTLTIGLAGDATSAEMRPAAGSAGTGLRFLTPAGSDAAVDRLLRTLATAGTASGSPAEPIVISFSGSTMPPSITPVQPGWMLRTVLRLIAQHDRAIAPAAQRAASSETASPWTAVAWGGDGSVLARTASSGNALLVDIAAPPDSFAAAAIARAVLAARLDPEAYAEREIARADEATVAAWTRPAGPIGPAAWRNADVSDARWCWLAVLTLLGVEQLLRSRSPRRQSEGVERAAA